MVKTVVELSDVTVYPDAPGGTEGGRKAIASGLDLRIGKGEWVHLIGPNGSGKSTLAKLLAGCWRGKVEGKVKRDPETFGTVGRVPIVMQHPEASIVGATPYEDALLAMERIGVPGERIPALTERAMSEVGLAAVMHRHVDRLSGGQQQLTAIAGGLVQQSPFIVLDEPTAMLDPNSAQAVHEAVRRLHARGATVVWATQKLDELRPGDRIVAMQAGRIAYDGDLAGFWGASPGQGAIDRIGWRDAPDNRENRTPGMARPEGGMLPNPRLAPGGGLSVSGLRITEDGRSGRDLVDCRRLHLAGGEITLLIGRNGAGKSTLLEALAGLREPAAGRIDLGAEPLWKRRGKPNRRVLLQLGIAPQRAHAQWFCATAADELRYSQRAAGVDGPEAAERAKAALAAVGLPPETAGRDPWTLSGGQQRRLALACLLACGPAWLLLDEPTAGLDAEGVSRLRAVLSAHKAAGGGAIIATHDPDALLPVADRVVEIDGGVVREAMLAAEWAKSRADRSAAAAASESPAAGADPQAADRSGSGATELKRRGSRSPGSVVHGSVAQGSVWEQFDPRALIAAYLLGAAGLLMQSSWPGLLAASLTAVAVLYPLRATLRPWIGAIRAYALLVAIVALIAGIRPQPFGVDWDAVSATALRLGRLLPIMVLGLPLAALVTPLRMQRALEQTFGFLGRVGIPVQRIALTVALMFRFIPLLAAEWGKYSRIAVARGKFASRPGRVPLRMLRSAILPYLVALLRLGDQVAEALEGRGYGTAVRRPTFGFRLKPGRRDGLLVLAAAAWFGLLWFMARWL
ncbi:putative ABC transporter ATP-binding protein [Paenibacillus cisolokensis]|uniref:ABC transporter ATP-binding protein n=1 Tax=Paenibacillus cisolokensis TaxID=1658519 RepID=A0ABQ4NBG6_9BACL|nr:putative ABC transporter ATP-binding protein [Paenibacillus cisolokensis]